jgi:hypothetical protein
MQRPFPIFSLLVIWAINNCGLMGQTAIGPLHPIHHDSLLKSWVSRFKPDSIYVKEGHFASWFHYYQYLNALPYAERESQARIVGYDIWGYQALRNKFNGEPFDCPLETWQGWRAAGTQANRQNETGFLASCAKSRVLAIDFHPHGIAPEKYQFLIAMLDTLWGLGYKHLAFPVLSPPFTSPSCLFQPCGMPIRDRTKALFFRLAVQKGFKIIQYPPLHSEIYVPDSGTRATDPFLGYYTCQDRFSDEMVAEWIFQLTNHPTMKMLLFEPPMSTISFCLAEAKIPVCSWRFAYDAQLMPHAGAIGQANQTKLANDFSKSLRHYAIDAVMKPKHQGYPSSPNLPTSLEHWLIRMPVLSQQMSLNGTEIEDSAEVSQIEAWRSIGQQLEQWAKKKKPQIKAKGNYCLSVYWLTDEDIGNQTKGIPQSIPIFEAARSSLEEMLPLAKQALHLRKGTYRFCLVNSELYSFCANDWIVE